jgi:hypothetical protein
MYPKSIFYSLIFGLVIVVLSCKQSGSQNVESLLKIDKEFSDYSMKYGISKSFLKFCDSNAVVVRDSSMPIKGFNELAKIYDTTQKSSNLLSWEPLIGDIAQSGEIGYTYGTWKFMDSLKTVLAEGCYVTVWKMDSKGNWKWVLDTGTQGLSRKGKH